MKAPDSGPPRAKRRDLESPIQAAIVEAIRVAYPAALAFSVPNGGFLLPPRTVAKLKWTGLYPGIPDLVITWPGDFGFMEVKSADGVVSKDQKDAHKILIGQGHRVAVVRSVDQAIATLTEWGVPTLIVTGLAA